MFTKISKDPSLFGFLIAPRGSALHRALPLLTILGCLNAQSQPLPEPLARWTFDADARDEMGRMNGSLYGNARIADGRLILDGDSYVETAPLPWNVTEKTLVVKVALSTLDQQGGGAISLETNGGETFDSIVFGEREPGKWMAGSDLWNRTVDQAATPEDANAQTFVQMVAVYKADNSIALYRNGRLYGAAWIPDSVLQTYPADNSSVLLGLRHNNPGGNKFLSGEIDEAALYDRALTSAEVAALAKQLADYSIRDSQISGSAGASAGGDFRLQGGVQTTAASSSGGGYDLKAGFWRTIGLVQMPGMPELTIYLDADSPVLLWVFGNGLILEESSDVPGSNWTKSLLTPATADGKTTVRIGHPVGRKFFRLRQTNP